MTAHATARYRSFYATSAAADFADIPTAFLEARERQEVTALLKRIADREYPYGKFGPNGELRASECVDVAVLSAFWAGVATAWYTMAALNGRDGARANSDEALTETMQRLFPQLPERVQRVYVDLVQLQLHGAEDDHDHAA